VGQGPELPSADGAGTGQVGDLPHGDLRRSESRCGSLQAAPRSDLLERRSVVRKYLTFGETAYGADLPTDFCCSTPLIFSASDLGV